MNNPTSTWKRRYLVTLAPLSVGDFFDCLICLAYPLLLFGQRWIDVYNSLWNNVLRFDVRFCLLHYSAKINIQDLFHIWFVEICKGTETWESPIINFWHVQLTLSYIIRLKELARLGNIPDSFRWKLLIWRMICWGYYRPKIRHMSSENRHDIAIIRIFSLIVSHGAKLSICKLEIN